MDSSYPLLLEAQVFLFFYQVAYPSWSPLPCFVMPPLQAILHVVTPLFISSLFYPQALLFFSSIIDLFTRNLCFLNSITAGNLCKEKRTMCIKQVSYFFIG